ncbi:hypothetical protein [Flavobacterium psychrotrophum]|uniref:hypothetical protein n=1 Tax=Flavobacterium psychrotrophum TaxID=2294119 RepID=UPI000E31CFF0|nr:hypothetical protein [Flavobacterium psychrotrophum]
MKMKYFEYITVYLSVFLVCIFIGVMVRSVLIEIGVDQYTAGVFFWISSGFGILVFAILNLLFNDLAERLLKRFLKAKKDKYPDSLIPSGGFEKLQEKQLNSLVEPELAENKNSGINIELVREEQQNIVKNQRLARIDNAIRYAQKQFALYTSDDDLKQLCENLIIYADDLNFEKIKPVKVKDLSNLDLYHFGWNIWNFFKVSRQERAAKFLKLSFADALKDVEEHSIKTHLKDDERKGLIKILADFRDF